jgi:hypothetical protein
MPKIQRIVEKAALRTLGRRKASTIPPVWQIEEEKTAIVMVNWHWSLGSFVRSNPPNLVEIGTMHCRDPKPLPKVISHTIWVDFNGNAAFLRNWKNL